MKYLILSLLLATCCAAKSQNATNTNRKDSLNIYYKSLSNYLEYLKNHNYKIPDTILIEDDFKLGTDSLLTQIGAVKLEVITFQQVSDLLKLKKSISVYRIFPLDFYSGQFHVALVPFHVTFGKKRKSINYGNGGGFDVVYKFANGIFNYEKVENHYL